MASAAALMAWTPAWAQTAPAQPAAEPAPSRTVGEVVVNARRRAERLQDVPVVVTVLNQQKLNDAQVTTARQLVQFVPSLNIGTGNMRDFQRFTLRGQGVTLGAGEGVTVYVNEAPIPQFGAGGPGLYFDLDNLQVLNGPQGTLFGRNTTGGAVLFTPHRPVDRNEGFIQAGYGAYNNREIAGVANFALMPGMLDVRISGEIRKRDGYTQSVVNGAHYDDMNYKAFRLGVLFKPTRQIENYLLLSYNRNQTDGTGFLLTDVNQDAHSGGLSGATFGLNAPTTVATAFGATMGLNQYLALQRQLGVRKTFATAPGFWFQEDIRAVNTTTIELPGNLTFKNIASFNREQINAGFDIDGTPDPIVEWNKGPLLQNPSGYGVSKNDYLTEEVQVSGKSLNNKLNWTTGAFYENSYPYGVQGQDVIQFGRLQQGIFGESSATKALFAQGTLDLGLLAPVLDRLKLTAGYRYTWDAKTSRSNLSGLGKATCDFTNVGLFPNCLTVYSKKWNAPTYIAGLDYKIERDTLVYFKFSRGYKSGGFNAGINPLLADKVSFAPEFVQDYEIGLKNDTNIFDIPIRTDLAIFHDEYTNMQRNESFVAPDSVPPQIVNIVTNAGAAAIDGFEAQIDARFKAFDVNLTYSYLDARYTKFTLIQPPATPPAGVNLKGVRLPYAPTDKVGATIRYHLPIDPNLGDLTVNAAANYQSIYRWGDVTQPGNILGNYTLVNFGMDWDHFAGRPIHIEAFVTNAFDRKDKAGSLAYFYSIGQSAASYIEPRMYGFRVRYAFGGG